MRPSTYTERQAARNARRAKYAAMRAEWSGAVANMNAAVVAAAKAEREFDAK